MIIDFTISNYRSIKNPMTISFLATKDKNLEDYYTASFDNGRYRILKMACIMGANASGKSNLLRAFSLFPQLMLQPCETKQSSIRYDRFALDSAMDDKYSEMVINFICGSQRYCYEVRFDNNVVAYELLRAYPFGQRSVARKVYEKILDTNTMVSQIVWGDKYKSQSHARDLSVNLLPNRTLFGSFQKSNVDIPWMKEIVDWSSSYFLPIVNTTEQNLYGYTTQLLDRHQINKQQVENLLRWADFGISDLSLVKKQEMLPAVVAQSIINDSNVPLELKENIKAHPVIERVAVEMTHVGTDKSVSFDFNNESNGTKRYYELSSILLSLTNGNHFVTIDELDCKLHPDLYQHFINTFLTNAQHSQLVFTTHMREFLNDRSLYRDDSVWITEKNDAGETTLYSLADFDTSVLRKSTNRYNAYRMGVLGGVPHLGSTYITKPSAEKV